MKKLISIIIMIVTVFTLMSCGKNLKKGEIKIGFMPSLAAVPYIYAAEKGYYEEAGLDVEIIIFQKSTERDAAFTGNSINGVSTDFVAVGLYLENNLDVYVTAKTEEEFRLVTSKYYNEADITKTNNARVGISENTVINYLVDQVAEKHELNYQLIGIPAVPARKAALEALDEAQRIDMAIMPEPFPTLVINSGGNEIWKNTHDHIYVTCLAFKKDFVDQNVELMIKFHEATDRAINSLKNENYADYKEIIIKYNILDETTVDLVEEQRFSNLVIPDGTQFTNVMNWMKTKTIDGKPLITRDIQLEDILFDWRNK